MVEINCDFGDYENDITDEILDNVQRVCDEVIETEGYEGTFEVSISFVNDDEIRVLNAEYRNIDKKTDVLSFPMLEIDDLETMNFEEALFPTLLGDIIISVPTAREQANEFNHSLNREISFLTCHSMLHLLGYDHIDEEDAIIMENKQKDILEKLGILRSN